MVEEGKIGERFRIISELGSGGFGQTFLAEDLSQTPPQKCVIKQLNPQTKDPQIIALASRLFDQEARILYQLGKHPQIPSLVAHFEEKGEFYLVQEYVQGQTFAEEISAGKIYNQAEVLEIITQLLEVLAFVHRQNVIHRDIKPANLIRREADGKVVLIDFGAVKEVSKNTVVVNPNQPTQGTVAIGSEGYMPMEQLAGHPRFSSDVYAVGMFAIQLLTQVHPSKLRQNQRTGEWIWQDKTMVSLLLAESINQMIRYDFRQRFASADEALNSLRKLRFQMEQNRRPRNSSNQSNQSNQFDNLTQATFSLPFPSAVENSARSNHQTTQLLTSFPSSNSEAYSIDNYNKPRPELNRLNNNRLEINEESVFNGVTFSDWPDNSFFRWSVLLTLIVVGSTILIYSLVSVSPKFAQINDFDEKTKIRNWEIEQRDKGIFQVKQEPTQKEKKAETSKDWFEVAKSWQLAVDYFTAAEMSAKTPEDKALAQKELNFCLEKKVNAIQRSDKLRSSGK